MKNRKAGYAHALFVTYLFLNGLAAGHMVCNIRNIMARGFDDKMGVDVTLTLGALALTSSRGCYWYLRKKDNEK